MSIRKPNVTEEDVKYVREARRKAHQQKIVNDILSFVQNLESFRDADEFSHLFIKAINNALESQDETYRVSEIEIYNSIADIDFRFKGKFAEGEC